MNQQNENLSNQTPGADQAPQPRRRMVVKRTIQPPAGPENGAQRTPTTANRPPLTKRPQPEGTQMGEVKLTEQEKDEVLTGLEKAPIPPKEESDEVSRPAPAPKKAAKPEKPKKIKKEKNKKQSRKKTGVSKIKIVLWIVMLLALAAGIVVITLFATGNKHQKEVFRDGDMEYSIIYFGTTDENGNIAEGKLSFSDGTSGDIKANGDGTYTVNYSNGSVYVGEFKNFHRNGQGKLTLKNGDVYQGNFHYDRMWGEGTYTYVNGDVYFGMFENNLKSGTGKYTFVNGDVYEGEFANNLRNGVGKYTYSDGSIYQGKYVDNKRQDDNASMVIKYADGSQDVYVGGFANDNREGYGKYIWASGDCYEGNFTGNNINGHGKYTWASGRTYEGEFLNGNIVKDPANYPSTPATATVTE